MVLKTREGKCVLIDLASDGKIDFAKPEKTVLKSEHLRFATLEEVINVTRCEPWKSTSFWSAVRSRDFSRQICT